LSSINLIVYSFGGMAAGIGTDILKYGIPYAILALGIFISYRLLDFADLGCEGTFTLGGAVASLMVVQGVNPFLSLLIALISGLLAGTFTGILTTKLHIPPLLSGIITMTALFTINMIIMGGVSDVINGNAFSFFHSKGSTTGALSQEVRFYNPLYTLLHDRWNLSWVTRNYVAIFWLLIIIAIVISLVYYFFGTQIGMGVRATGMNPIMARAQGINTSFMMVMGLAISNGLIALAGASYSQVSGSANTQMGVGTLVIGLASIIIGEAIVGRKTFKQNMFAVIVGALIYYLIIALVINTGLLDAHFLKLLYAILVVIVLVTSQLKNLKQKKELKERHHA